LRGDEREIFYPSGAPRARLTLTLDEFNERLRRLIGE
jgi:hypothetical protein